MPACVCPCIPQRQAARCDLGWSSGMFQPQLLCTGSLGTTPVGTLPGGLLFLSLLPWPLFQHVCPVRTQTVSCSRLSFLLVTLHSLPSERGPSLCTLCCLINTVSLWLFPPPWPHRPLPLQVDPDCPQRHLLANKKCPHTNPTIIKLSPTASTESTLTQWPWEAEDPVAD